MDILKAKTRRHISGLSRSTSMVNKMLMSYYKTVNNAKKEGMQVAWTSIDYPSYILWAMDVVPVFPQVQAAFQAQRKKVKKMMLELESRWEIPHNICGEVKGVIGSVLFDSEISFDLPKPDILLTANSSCGAMAKGFKYLSQYMNVELLFSDFPFVYDDIDDNMMDYCSKQLERDIAHMESKFGKKLNKAKLNDIYENLIIALKLWEGICNLSTNCPAPVESLDLFLFSSVMMMFAGDSKLLDLYALLYNEISEQIIKNKERGYEENYRLLWHYLPIYSQKNFFKKLFEEYGATIVTGTFFPLAEDSSGGLEYEFKYPVTKVQIEEARQAMRRQSIVSDDVAFQIRELAMSVLQLDVNQSLDYKNSKIQDLIKRFGIDGVIMHCDKSCRPQSLPQYEIRRFLTEELKVPVLIFDADTMDDRYFAPSQITTRFEAFVEKMEARKRGALAK